MRPSDISSGGHVYDRTTGTWVGETQGTAGGGYTGDGVGRGTFVIHDANGPVGVHLAARPTQQVAANVVGNGGDGPGSAGAGATVPGPGSQVSGNGGTGPGALGVSVQPAPVTADKKKDNKPGRVIGPLIQDMEPTVTSVKVGGDWWQSNPWFSDAEQWTQRYGEGEIAETLFLVINVGADTFYNATGLGDYLGTQHVGPGAYNAEQWFNGGAARVNAPIPQQEPVDWGR